MNALQIIAYMQRDAVAKATQDLGIDISDEVKWHTSMTQDRFPEGPILYRSESYVRLTHRSLYELLLEKKLNVLADALAWQCGEVRHEEIETFRTALFVYAPHPADYRQALIDCGSLVEQVEHRVPLKYETVRCGVIT